MKAHCGGYGAEVVDTLSVLLVFIVRLGLLDYSLGIACVVVRNFFSSIGHEFCPQGVSNRESFDYVKIGLGYIAHDAGMNVFCSLVVF